MKFDKKVLSRMKSKVIGYNIRIVIKCIHEKPPYMVYHYLYPDKNKVSPDV